MSENLKTIRELADELGVSKQRIQQIIAKLSTNKMPNKEGNKYVLNQKDVHNIKVLMGIENEKSTTIKMEKRVVDYDVYLDTINSLKEKDEQIKGLLEVQKQTQNLLDQQQRLSLQDKKNLEEYKSEIKDLKAITTKKTTVEEEDINRQNNLEKKGKNGNNKPKNWWPFNKRR